MGTLPKGLLDGGGNGLSSALYIRIGVIIINSNGPAPSGGGIIKHKFSQNNVNSLSGTVEFSSSPLL